MAPNVLVCDDQPEVLVALDLLLKGAGYRTDSAPTPRRLLTALEQQPYDLVLTDMNFHRDTTSGREGLALVETICRRSEHPPVMVMTAWADIDLAVEAVRRGASGFVQKPWDNAKLLAEMERAIGEGKLSSSEKESARMVQERLLPARERRIGRAHLRADFSPAREVGGDYYDFFDLGAGRSALLLADVSGKGVPAALLMANLQALFHAQPAELLAQPMAAVERVNKLFFESTAPAHYATVFYAVYDEFRESLTWVNCGHPAAVLHRRGAEHSLESSAPPVGLFEKLNGEERAVEMRAGDRLIVCSDGILEADMVEDDCTQVELTICD